jgi:hypothetical protein
MNSKVKSKIIFSLAMLMVMLFGFQAIQAQSAKKKAQHDQERLEADAYAFAYASCKYELTKYKSEQKKDDSGLKKELKTDDLLYRRFALIADNKYKNQPELYPKFQRSVKSAWKELTVCVRYTNLLKALEELEKKSQ